MPQLKPSFVAKIEQALEDSVFTKNDFQIQFPTSGQLLVEIQFIHKPEYLLSVSEEKKQDRVTTKQALLGETWNEVNPYTRYVLKTTPGEYKSNATIELDDLGDLITSIQRWCESIRDDLYALAPRRDPLEVEKLKKRFQADIEAGIDDPEGYFTETEISKIRKKLDNIMDQLNKLNKEYHLTNEKLQHIQKEFKREFDEFKRSALLYQKGIWAKITANRIVKMVDQNINTSEGRDFLFDQIRWLLKGK